MQGKGLDLGSERGRFLHWGGRSKARTTSQSTLKASTYVQRTTGDYKSDDGCPLGKREKLRAGKPLEQWIVLSRKGRKMGM